MANEVRTADEQTVVDEILGLMRKYVKPGFFGSLNFEVDCQNGHVTHIQKSSREVRKLRSREDAGRR